MAVRYTNLPDNKNQSFGGAYSVYDVETVERRNMIIEDLSWIKQGRNPDDIRKDFGASKEYYQKQSRNGTNIPILHISRIK